MKFIKWKSLITTCVVCLFPILIGVDMWNDLPDTMAIHFNINNQPDNFAPKWFVVFGLPIMMMLLQIVCCIISDINSHKHGQCKKFERITLWIIPTMTFILHIVTLGYGLGWNINIRKVAFLIIGAVFIALGNYLPKLNYVKNYNIDTEKSRKINRFIGFGNVVMGILSFITVFLSPIASIIWLLLLIPYTIISVIYALIIVRKSE